MSKQELWQTGAVIYQIYPRSFFDAGNSGIGNLRGIIDKLNYLGGQKDSLGVTAIWLSPIYTSPMADFGYDVSNYTDVDPIFGDLDDFKLLLKEVHKRNIKIILDFVPNHSSDEHPWFTESQSSLDNLKRDWYVWKDPKADGSPPNNWLSVFGGSAWEFSDHTKQYYLHSYLTKQPDLNWDNPLLREAMKSAMRFWLDLGVDGFRVDAVDWMSKDPAFRDDPVAPHADAELARYEHSALQHTHSRNGPHLFDRLNEMTGVLNEYENRFMITEAHPETDNKIEGYLQYYEGVNPLLSAPFNFEGIHLHWEAKTFRKFVDSFQAAMKPGYTPIYTVGNHDESRIASRIGASAARTAAMMLLTLPGMAFIYYGEELGMTNVALRPEEVRDPFTQPGEGRDPQRTPMQWDSSANAGFSKAAPWLPLATDYRQVNVARESNKATSSLALYKLLLQFRNGSDTLKNGFYHSINTNENVFGYERKLDNEKLIILLNFSDVTQKFVIKNLVGVMQLSTFLDRAGYEVNEKITLRSHEGILIRNLND